MKLDPAPNILGRWMKLVRHVAGTRKKKKRNTKFWSGKLNRRDHFGDTCVHWKIMRKLILERQGLKVWICFDWIMIVVLMRPFLNSAMRLGKFK